MVASIQRHRFVTEDTRLRHGGKRPTLTRECQLGSDSDADTEILNVDRLILHCDFPDSVRRGNIFDDRGLTYLRHGAPQRKAKYSGEWYFARESWLYTTSSGPVVIHFVRPIDEPTHGFGASSTTGPPDQWMAICQVTPRYCVLAARRSMGERIPLERWNQVIERGAEEMDRLLSTDGAPQRFANQLRFNAGAYGLGSAPERLTLAVDIPIDALRQIASDDSSRAALRWQVRIRNSNGAWPVSSDSISAVALPPAAAGDGGRFATVIREYPLPAGRYDLRLVLSDSAGTRGAMYARDGVVVLGRGTTAGLSDVVLMPDPGQGASRTIEGVPVRLSPTFTAGASRSVAIGYVLQGVAGESVRVTVEIRKVADSGDRAALSLAFDEQPTSDREFLVRRIGIERLGNGGYDVTVSVPLPDGTTATRTQRMLVRR